MQIVRQQYEEAGSRSDESVAHSCCQEEARRAQEEPEEEAGLPLRLLGLRFPAAQELEEVWVEEENPKQQTLNPKPLLDRSLALIESAHAPEAVVAEWMAGALRVFHAPRFMGSALPPTPLPTAPRLVVAGGLSTPHGGEARSPARGLLPFQ